MIEIELPLPPKHASPRFDGHRAIKRRARQAYKSDCEMTIVAARVLHGVPEKLQPPITVSLDFYLYNPHMITGQTLAQRYDYYLPTDEDNAVASIKGALDAFVTTGLVPDDSKKYVRLGEINLYGHPKQHKKRTCLVARIEESE